MKESFDSSKQNSSFNRQGGTDSLSIFTKNSSQINRSNSYHSSDHNKVFNTDLINQNDNYFSANSQHMPQNQFMPQNQGYNMLEWLIFIVSVFSNSSLIFLAGIITVLITCNYYLLEIFVGYEFSDKQSIIQVLKIYCLGLLILTLILKAIKFVNWTSITVKLLTQEIYQHTVSLIIVVTLCLYIYLTVKKQSKSKTFINNTFSQISHLITWYALGSLSYLSCNFIGMSIFSTQSFKIYGQTIITFTYIITLSIIAQNIFHLQNNLFNIIYYLL